MPPATLKEMARTRALKVGHFVVEFATPGIGHMLANAGCDFVLFDTEHSGFHTETIKRALRYFEAAGLPAIVRVPSRDYHHVARAMDMGAEGLMAPMVSTPEEAEAIVRAVKYAPRGERGVALAIAHDRYRGGDVLDKLAAANDRSTVFLQIETAEGVENADAIAAIDGADCLWIGHFDLSASLGAPGRFDDPKFVAAVDKVRAAARRHGKALGRLGPDAAACVALHAEGFDFVCCGGDAWLYQAALARAVAEVREGCAEGGA